MNNIEFWMLTTTINLKFLRDAHLKKRKECAFQLAKQYGQYRIWNVDYNNQSEVF